MRTGFTIPIAYYPANGTCPKETLAIFIQDVISAVHSINLTTIATIFDQGPTYRGAITILRSRCPQGEFDPVYDVDGKMIVHLWDFPHLLKTTC